MLSRIIGLSLLLFFALGDSLAFGQAPDKKATWEDVVQAIDMIQLLIIRFGPFLMAVGILLILIALFSIRWAIREVRGLR
jgi:hypothetical protein